MSGNNYSGMPKPPPVQNARVGAMMQSNNAKVQQMQLISPNKTGGYSKKHARTKSRKRYSKKDDHIAAQQQLTSMGFILGGNERKHRRTAPKKGGAQVPQVKVPYPDVNGSTQGNVSSLTSATLANNESSKYDACVNQGPNCTANVQTTTAKGGKRGTRSTKYRRRTTNKHKKTTKRRATHQGRRRQGYYR